MGFKLKNNMKDFTNLWNMATKTIVIMEFLLDEGDIEYLERLPTLDKKTRDIYL